MEQLTGYITDIYKNRDYYTQRKARYTILFICIMGLYGVINGALEVIVNGDVLFFVIASVAVLLLMVVLSFMLKKGLLLTVQYTFLLVGVGIGVQYLDYSTHFQFYTQMIMVLIVGITIHMNKVQMLLVYTLVNGLVLFRAYYLYTLITHGYVDDIMLNQSFQAALGIILFSLIIAYFDKVLGKEIRETKELGEISVTDSLTHLSNRASLNQSLELITESGEAYIFGILDIDFFKNVNDKLGHQIGDRVLIALANLMRDHFKEPYSIYRWGGEEFAVLVSGVDCQEAYEFLDSFRLKVSEHDFDLGYQLTISGGLARAKVTDSRTQVVIDADNALYEAKNRGRNMILGAGELKEAGDDQ